MATEHADKSVKTSHFVFSSDVEDFKLGSLSDFGREVVRNYLHIGIVSEACEKPYKQYEVLLVHWPSNIPRSAYEDKSRALLVDVKKVRTIIFAVPEKRLNEYMQSHTKIPMDDVVASTAILTEADDWRLMEAKLMTSFFNIVDRAYSHVSEGRDSWKNYSTNRLDTQWKQMIFLCCFNYDVGYYAKEMTTRNWSRICRRMVADETHDTSKNLLDSEVPRGGIYDLLVLWSRYPALLRDMIKILKDVNEEKQCLPPLDVLEKLKCTLISILFVAKRFACYVCSYAASAKYKLAVHMRKHTGEELFQCDYCGKSFIEKRSSKYHLASQHHAKGNFNYKCYSCNTQCDNVTFLREHVVTHAKEKKFQCSLCFRRFVNSTDLQKHSRNHGTDKPFECHICGKKFLLERLLKLHYVVHSEKAFTCGFCGKAFRQNTHKNTHEVSVHNSFTNHSGVIEIDS